MAQRFPVTVGLVVALIGLFLLETALGGSTEPATLVRMGALRADRVAEHGELFRWFTATWLHFGPVHLLLNLFALVQLSSLVEHVWGGARALLAFLVSGLCASLVTATFGEFGRPVVGASGAIMGLAGLLLGARYVGDPALRLFLREVLGRRLLWSVLLTFGVGLSLELFMPMVDNLGHLGGFLAGVGLAFALPESDSGEVPTRWGLATLVLLTASSGGWCVAAGDDALATLDHDTAVQLRHALGEADGGLRGGALLTAMVDRYEAAGELEEGRAVYARELAQLDEVGVQVVVAAWFEQEGREREVAAALERWLELGPHDPLVLNAYAWFLVTSRELSLRDPQRAEALSRKSLRRIDDPSSRAGQQQRAAFTDTLAEALWQQGRRDEALATQREAVELGRALRDEAGWLDRLGGWATSEADTLQEMEERLVRMEGSP